jgi:hypothetical protein
LPIDFNLIGTTGGVCGLFIPDAETEGQLLFEMIPRLIIVGRFPDAFTVDEFLNSRWMSVQIERIKGNEQGAVFWALHIQEVEGIWERRGIALVHEKCAQACYAPGLRWDRVVLG